MKKTFMFLLMACLVGGFSINANAQAKGVKNSNNVDKSKVENTISAQDIDKMLKEFEGTISKCEGINTKLQQVEKKLANIARIENGRTRRATEPMHKNGVREKTSKNQESKENLEREKTTLQKDYTNCHREMRNVKDSFKTKVVSAMTPDQKSTYDSLITRFNTLPTPATK